VKRLLLALLLLPALVSGQTITGPVKITSAWIMERSGLVGWWHLDEGSGTIFRDSSRREFHGTLTGSPAWDTTTQKIGTAALILNGSSQRATTNANFVRLTNNMSLAFWINASASQVAVATVLVHIGANSSPINGGWAFCQTGAADRTKYQFNWTTGSLAGENTSSQDFVIPSAAWHHVAVTKSGTNVKMYLDGNTTPVVNYTGTTATIFYDGDATFSMGWWPTGSNRYWAGTLDDVRIYAYTLSAAEVAEIYAWRP